MLLEGNNAISYCVECIVAGLHLRWRGVWQRPNHLLTRFADAAPVIVLEEPLVGERDDDELTQSGPITIVTPHRRSAPPDAVDARAIATVRRLVGARRALLWLYTPMMLPLADAFPGAPIVFDKMDELTQFAHADRRLPEREDAVLARAAIAFGGGRSLARGIEGRTRRTRCYPSGVDVAHFARARQLAPHDALQPYAGRRIYGYVGVIDERIDLALIDALARAAPDATVAMVGPVVKIDPSSLPRRPNIVYLGKRGYDELPRLLAGFDVALMPFALNAHTANISPTKTLEYLAAGLPVVSTAVPDVVADHRDTVAIAATPTEFIRLVAEARADDPARRKRADETARASSWEAIAAGMRADLRDASIELSSVDNGRGPVRLRTDEGVEMR